MKSCLFLTVFASIFLYGWACSSGEFQNGCKINGDSCTCGYGCRSEYIYNTRRACHNALRKKDRFIPYGVPQSPPVETPAPVHASGRAWNICYQAPCNRGICIQTTNETGFTCKCEGTGFYGLRCEKACPTSPVSGMVFPHECVII